MVSVVQPPEEEVCERIVPVKVKGKNSDKVLETYAFLDNGSDVTLCDEKLVEDLGIDGVEKNLSL